MSTLLATSEIARMYHVTNATVLNWIHARKLKAFTTPGGHYRVSREDLYEFARTHNALPAAEDLDQALRLLLVGTDLEYYGRLRSAVLFRWQAAQIEQARTEFEIGWWLARLRPTHLVVHPDLTPTELLERCRQLVASGAASGARLTLLPGAPDKGLGEWIDRIDFTGR